MRRRLDSQLRERGLEPDVVRQADNALDSNILTLGFARRFTDYKRPNLLLSDLARLDSLLLDETAPGADSCWRARRIPPIGKARR